MCRTAFGLALLGVTLVLVGCGGDAAPLDPVAQAADKSAQAGTYRFDLVLVTDLGRATGHGAGDRSSSDTTIDFGPAFSDTALCPGFGGVAFLDFRRLLSWC
jgi:hypothetical protein